MLMQASAGSIATGMGNNNPQMPRDDCGCWRSIQVCSGSPRRPWLKRTSPQFKQLFALFETHLSNRKQCLYCQKQMGTPFALYKPFDLSLQNLIKYKYLLYISFFVLFGFDCALLPKEKKERKRKSSERKRKKRKRCINFAICF